MDLSQKAVSCNFEQFSGFLLVVLDIFGELSEEIGTLED